MRLLPGPADLLRLPAHAVEAITEALGLVPRLVAVVGEVERLLTRVGALLDRIEITRERADLVVVTVEATNVRAETVVAHTEPVVVRAATLVNRLTPLLDRALPLLDRLLPVADRLEPMLAQLADTTSGAEVDAMTRLIDLMPDVVDKLGSDILPVLDTLGTVAPDLRDLLDASRQLNQMLGAIPGLGKMKRKIEDEQDAEDAAESPRYRSGEEPPAAPLRTGGTTGQQD